jgi:hypothetical protein
MVRGLQKWFELAKPAVLFSVEFVQYGREIGPKILFCETIFPCLGHYCSVGETMVHKIIKNRWLK